MVGLKEHEKICRLDDCSIHTLLINNLLSLLSGLRINEATYGL